MLGSPIAHSLSPVLHRAAYRALGLDDWAYEAIECDEAGLPALLDSLGPEWAGLSLTMPLKRAVLPLLDSAEALVAEVDGANTVVFGAGGRQGFNTDVPGMISALAEAGVTTASLAGPPAAEVSPADVSPAAGAAAPAVPLVLGAGATACAALAALRGIGVAAAAVATRDPATADPLLAVAARLGVEVALVPFGAEPGPAGRPLLISTVPAGAADIYAERIAAGTLIPRAVLDVVYHPWPTRLASAAAQAGVVVAGGFDLLLHQAARQVELMTGRDAPTAAMREAGLAALAGRSGPGGQAG